MGSDFCVKEDWLLNIVVILVDDFGWNDFSWFGGGVVGGIVLMLNIDLFVCNGVYFVNGYFVNGICVLLCVVLMIGCYGMWFGFEFILMLGSFLKFVF